MNCPDEEIAITRAKAEEARELMEFFKIVGSESDNLSFGKEGIPVTEEEERERLRKLETSTEEAYFVMRRRNQVIGTAHYTAFTGKRFSHRGTIGLCIRKSECGHGLGKRLMETLIDFGRNVAGSEIISLEVRSDNVAAIRLYEKFGLKKLCTFPGFFKIDGRLIDFDIMEKNL